MTIGTSDVLTFEIPLYICNIPLMAYIDLRIFSVGSPPTNVLLFSQF